MQNKTGSTKANRTDAIADNNYFVLLSKFKIKNRRTKLLLHPLILEEFGMGTEAEQGKSVGGLVVPNQ